MFQGEVPVFPDAAHSTRETRFLGIGRTTAGRHVFTAFTLRTRHGERWIRIVSTRYIHAKEVSHFKAEIARRHS